MPLASHEKQILSRYGNAFVAFRSREHVHAGAFPRAETLSLASPSLCGGKKLIDELHAAETVAPEDVEFPACILCGSFDAVID